MKTGEINVHVDGRSVSGVCIMCNICLCFTLMHEMCVHTHTHTL